VLSTGVAGGPVVAGAVEPGASELDGGAAVFDPDDEHPAMNIPATTTSAVNRTEA